MAQRHVPAVGNHVLVSGKKKVGMVSSLLSDGEAGEPTAFVVQYGLLKKKNKRLTLKQIKWINDGSVVLEMSDKQFAALPDWLGAEAPVEPGAASGPTPA